MGSIAFAGEEEVACFFIYLLIERVEMLKNYILFIQFKALRKINKKRHSNNSKALH